MSQMPSLPAIDHEAESAQLLRQLKADIARRDAARARRMAHHVGPKPAYSYNPQHYGFEHTPELAEQVLAMVHKAGYPRARLIGSLAAGKVSKKDIDILVRIWSLKSQRRFVTRMTTLFNPSQIALVRGGEGVGMVAMPHGVLDFFFVDPGRYD
jgi:hypothetical protein